MNTLLTKKSWHARAYAYSWARDYRLDGLPHNLCPYFWKTLLGLLLLPISWMGRFLPRHNERHHNCISHLHSVFLVFCISLALSIMGCMIGGTVLTLIYGGTPLPQHSILMFVFGIPILAVFLAIILGSVKIMALSSKRFRKTEGGTIIRTMIKSKKQKICPSITWK